MIREDMRFDVRTQNARIRRNEFTSLVLEKELEGLPDEAAEAVETEVRFTSPFYDAHYHKSAPAEVAGE